MSALETHRQEPLKPPEPPVEGSCCGRGCEWCVWVCYDQALRRYEAARAKEREPQDSFQEAGVSGEMTQSPETGV